MPHRPTPTFRPSPFSTIRTRTKVQKTHPVIDAPHDSDLLENVITFKVRAYVSCFDVGSKRCVGAGAGTQRRQCRCDVAFAYFKHLAASLVSRRWCTPFAVMVPSAMLSALLAARCATSLLEMKAPDALEIGLIDAVVPEGELEARAIAFAADVVRESGQ